MLQRGLPGGHILAMGGGGFSMEPENPLLDEFLISLAGIPSPKICFIPTASADSPGYIVRFYRAFSGRAIPTDLTLTDSPLPRKPARTADLADFLAYQDIIFVGGGNTVNLLALWRAHGLDVLLRQALERGAVLSGISAGMMCWFRGGVTDSYGGLDALNDGLGFIEGSACPHYDGEPERRPTYQRLIASGLRAGFAADDGAALHFHNGQLVDVVTSRPKANAYRVELVDGQVVETKLASRFLGPPSG
ncbi:MAG: peptidase E [Steroidobacteraceae bacterium]|jgi:dipeptidase E